MDISIVLNVIFLGFVVLIALKFDEIKNKMNWYNSQKNKIKRYEEILDLNQSAQVGGIVFAGDSITHWFPTDELFKPHMIYNRGNAGYFTYELLKVVDETIISLKPHKLFILIGTNDMSVKKILPKAALKRTESIIDRIKCNSPETTIYLISVYPVNTTDNSKILKKVKKTKSFYGQKVIELNSLYKELCKQKNLVYIDIFDELLDEEGQLKLEYTLDGVHLSIAGYHVVKDHLLDYI